MTSASCSFRTPRACATVMRGCGTNNLVRLCAARAGAGAASFYAVSLVMREEATIARGLRDAGEGGGGYDWARRGGMARRQLRNVYLVARPPLATYEGAWLWHASCTGREAYDLIRGVVRHAPAAMCVTIVPILVAVVAAFSFPAFVVNVGDTVVAYVVEILF